MNLNRIWESFTDESFQIIARRYFVLNGFDGILTVLGITAGSYSTGVSNPKILITSGMGAAVALGVSGLMGAYVTEKAERLKRFKEIQDAMLSPMSDSIHRENVKRRSLAISIINGLSPFLCATLCVIPFLLPLYGLMQMSLAYYLSAGAAVSLLALLGGFLGKISRESIIAYALKMIGVGVVTAFLSLLLGLGG